MFKEAGSYDENGHCYRVYTHDGAEWLNELAEEYRQLRCACIAPLTALRVDGIAFDANALQKRLQRASLPDYPSGVPTAFEVVRSDFGELIGYLLLERLWGTTIPYKSIRDRDTIQQPARGLDLVGLEGSDTGDTITLVLGEVKVSGMCQGR